MSVGPQAADRPPPLRPAWSDSWRDWRNRLLSSARFRRWAAAFPLTRPIARARAAEVFDLVAGFVYSQVLAAALQLRLLDRLAEGPAELSTLARAMAMPEMQAERLLAACAALKLAERRSGDRWGLGPRGAALVGEPGLAALVAHHAALYRDLADPVAMLRRGDATQLNAYWPYAEGEDPAALGDAEVARYSTLMTASQPMVAEQVLDAVDLRSAHCLLDVGGGEGAFLQAVAARAPHLQLKLFDLPAVADRARTRLARLGPTSSAWCAWCTTMTTRRWPRCCAPRAPRCQRPAACCWPSRWPAPRVPRPWATPISASTCWPCAAAARARPSG